MPYSGPDDKTLPPRIKAMPANKRRAFAAAFNSAYGSKPRPGENAKGRESRAYATANNAANHAGAKSMTAIGEKAATQSVNGTDLERGDFADQGEADLPSTWGLPLTNSAGGAPDANRVANAITALQPGGFRGNKAQTTDPHAQVVGRIRSAIGKLVDESTRSHLLDRLSQVAGMKDMGDMFDDDEDEDEAPSYYGGSDAVDPQVMPYGGAESFAGMDAYQTQAEQVMELDQVNYQFDTLLMNIRCDDDLDPAQRADAMAALVNEYRDRIAAAASGVGQRAFSESEAIGEFGGGMRIFKDAGGQYRWVAIVSNNFRDRMGEVFPAERHKEYVAWVDARKAYPPLRLWHVPYDIGDTDQIDYTDDGFLVSTGTFRPGMEQIAENLAELSKELPLGCSHGFVYDPREMRDGVFPSYRSFEQTVLPLQYAANALTGFGIREATVLTKEKRDFFVKALGSEGAVANLENTLGRLRQKALAEGVGFRELFTEDLFAATKDDDDNSPAGSPAATGYLHGAGGVLVNAAAVPPVVGDPVAVSQALDQASGEPEPEPAPAEVPPADATPADEPPEPVPASAAAPDGADATGVRALTEVVTQAMATALMPLGERIDHMEERFRAIESGEMVQAWWRPKVGPIGTTPASASAETLIPESVARQIKAMEEVPPEHPQRRAVGGALRFLQRAAAGEYVPTE